MDTTKLTETAVTNLLRSEVYAMVTDAVRPLVEDVLQTKSAQFVVPMRDVPFSLYLQWTFAADAVVDLRRFALFRDVTVQTLFRGVSAGDRTGRAARAGREHSGGAAPAPTPTQRWTPSAPPCAAGPDDVCPTRRGG